MKRSQFFSDCIIINHLKFFFNELSCSAIGFFHSKIVPYGVVNSIFSFLISQPTNTPTSEAQIRSTVWEYRVVFIVIYCCWMLKKTINWPSHFLESSMHSKYMNEFKMPIFCINFESVDYWFVWELKWETNSFRSDL